MKGLSHDSPEWPPAQGLLQLLLECHDQVVASLLL